MNLTLLGIILGLLGLVVPLIVSIIIAFLQRSVKEITYAIMSQSPLLSVDEKIRDKVKISYEGKEVKNAHLVVLNIKNSGNIPIMPNDYVEPIKFSFGLLAEIISVNISETKPVNIKEKISVVMQKNEIIIMPYLLNKGYSITIAVVLSRFTGRIKADALVAGVESLKKVEPNTSLFSPNRVKIFILLYPAAVSLLGIIYSVIGFYSVRTNFDMINFLLDTKFAPKNILFFDASLFVFTFIFSIFNFVKENYKIKK